MNRKLATAVLVPCLAVCGCAEQTDGARIGELWGEGFAKAQTSTEPVPMVGLFYHGDPDDRKLQVEYYRARGWADGWRQRHEPATGNLGVSFGKGYDDGVQRGPSLASRSFRPLPTEAVGWTRAEQAAYSLGFRHGEAAQARARWRAEGRRLPRRPEQAPARWVDAAKGLSGRFRSTEPVNRATAKRWAQQFEFHGDGTATLSTVDESGAPGGRPPIKGWLALNETALTFYPFETNPRPLFAVLMLIYDGGSIRWPDDTYPMMMRLDNR